MQRRVSCKRMLFPSLATLFTLNQSHACSPWNTINMLRAKITVNFSRLTKSLNTTLSWMLSEMSGAGNTRLFKIVWFYFFCRVTASVGEFNRREIKFCMIIVVRRNWIWDMRAMNQSAQFGCGLLKSIYRYRKVLTRRMCLIIKSFFSLVIISHILVTLWFDSGVIGEIEEIEKLDASYPHGSKCKEKNFDQEITT